MQLIMKYTTLLHTNPSHTDPSQVYAPKQENADHEIHNVIAY